MGKVIYYDDVLCNLCNLMAKDYVTGRLSDKEFKMLAKLNEWVQNDINTEVLEG